MTSVHSVPVHQGEQKNVDFCSRIVTLSAHTHFFEVDNFQPNFNTTSVLLCSFR